MLAIMTLICHFCPYFGALRIFRKRQKRTDDHFIMMAVKHVQEHKYFLFKQKISMDLYMTLLQTW